MSLRIANLLAGIVAIGLLVLPARTSADATTLWTNTTNGRLAGSTTWEDGVALPGGGFVVCGTVVETSTTIPRAYVRCWAPDGTTRWTYEYPDPQGDLGPQFYLVDRSPDGSLVAIGTRNAVGPYPDMIAVRLSEQGTELFSVVLNMNTYANGGSDIEIDDNGSIYVSLSHSAGGAVFRKLSPLFLTLWSNTDAHFKRFETLPNGTIAACGSHWATGGFFGLLRPNGTILTQTTLPDDAVGLATTPDSESFVTDVDGNLHKFGDAGSLLWTRHPTFSHEAIPVWHESKMGLGPQVVVAGIEYPDSLVTVAFSGRGDFAWRNDESVVALGAGMDHKGDRFGNSIISLTTRRDFGTDNYNARCYVYDAWGRLQWKNKTADSTDSDEFTQRIMLDDRLRLCIAGGKRDRLTQDTFGLGWRTSQYFHASPDLASTLAGSFASGSLTSLEADDGNELILAPRTQSGPGLPIDVEFRIYFPINDVNPGTTDLRLAFRARSHLGDAAMKVQVFDWTTRSWRNVLVQLMTTSEYAYEIPLTSIGRFFRPGSTLVKVRFGATRSPFSLTNQYQAALDLLELRSDTQ